MHSRPAYTQGSLVPVVIDPENPKRYALELQGRDTDFQKRG